MKWANGLREALEQFNGHILVFGTAERGRTMKLGLCDDPNRDPQETTCSRTVASPIRERVKRGVNEMRRGESVFVLGDLVNPYLPYPTANPWPGLPSRESCLPCTRTLASPARELPSLRSFQPLVKARSY
jgi:hypothetical protein